MPNLKKSRVKKGPDFLSDNYNIRVEGPDNYLDLGNIRVKESYGDKQADEFRAQGKSHRRRRLALDSPRAKFARMK